MDLEYNNFLELGRKYEASGKGKSGGESKLPPQVVYNMFSMALENYCMAILTFNNTMADNHTFTDLMNNLDEIHPLKPELKRRILELEKYQQICSFTDPVVIKVDSIINREFQMVIAELAKVAELVCNKAA